MVWRRDKQGPGRTEESGVEAAPAAAPMTPETPTASGSGGAREEEGTPPSGRRRPRGRRGGRRRRAAGVEPVDESSETAETTGKEAGPAGPGIAEEAAEAAETPAATRRSRGGRRRRRPADAEPAGKAAETAETTGKEAEPAGPGIAEEAAEAAETPAATGRSRGGRRRRARPAPEAGETAAGTAGDDGSAPPATVEAGPAGEVEEQPVADAPSAEKGGDSAKTRSRRGRRRKKDSIPAGDGDEQPGVEATDGVGPEPVVAAAAPETGGAKSRKRRGAGDDDTGSVQDRAAKGEAPRPRRRGRGAVGPPPQEAAERIILGSEDLGDLRIAVVEDGRLAAVYLQRQVRPSILGNIYQARVQSVLKGMDAAFVDFGLEKNGFLHVDEVTLPDEDGGKRSRRITQLLQNGQEILVQVTKDPMKGKGARLTTRVSLPGRYLVYVPGGSGAGVSRRLPQDERDRLRELCRQLRPRKAGLIVRTVAEGKGLEELRRDLQYLSRLWSRIKTKAEKSAAPALIHEEVDVALSAARDLVDETCKQFVVDSPKVRKRVIAYLQRVAPELAERVVLHQGDQPLFEEYGVEDGIDATLARRVPLASGGNLVIDHTEALTVVDVNSGRYTGGSGLEETITRTNLEAAEEVVRQLRLRDIGGIIVIDFIDMSRRENREAVLQKLESALARDKTKSYVVEISPVGLVEMTRQATTDGTRGLMTVACPTCNGAARVLTADSVVRDVERMLTRTLPATPGEAVLIEVRRDVADRLLEADRIRRLERRHGKRLFFEGSAQLPVDTSRVVASGALDVVQGQCLPVREGEEVEAELRHTLPYSPRDAVAVVDGYQIVVRGARQHLGSTRRIRIETALRSGGVATMV